MIDFRILEDNGAGFCVVNGDDEQLVRAALQLADNRKLAAAMSANARRLLEKQFSVESAVSQLFTHLNALKSPARARPEKAPRPNLSAAPFPRDPAQALAARIRRE